jgi:hypothetical protein
MLTNKKSGRVSFYILCVAQTEVFNAQSGSALNITRSISTGNVVVRIPTRTGSLWRMEATASTSISATLTRGYLYAPIMNTAAFPTASLALSLSSSLSSAVVRNSCF